MLQGQLWDKVCPAGKLMGCHEVSIDVRAFNICSSSQWHSQVAAAAYAEAVDGYGLAAWAIMQLLMLVAIILLQSQATSGAGRELPASCTWCCSFLQAAPDLAACLILC
jgi:hypothetical protein